MHISVCTPRVFNFYFTYFVHIYVYMYVCILFGIFSRGNRKQIISSSAASIAFEGSTSLTRTRVVFRDEIVRTMVFDSSEQGVRKRS